jgi:hypothetical protein
VDSCWYTTNKFNILHSGCSLPRLVFDIVYRAAGKSKELYAVQYKYNKQYTNKLDFLIL